MEFKDIREDFTSDVYNTLDFLPTNNEANRIIDSFDSVVDGVIVIPKGATNGDMIKAMFPDCKDWKAKIEENDGEVYEVHFVQLPNSLTVNKYEESLWNAPYKRGNEE